LKIFIGEEMKKNQFFDKVAGGRMGEVKAVLLIAYSNRKGFVFLLYYSNKITIISI
jgi:hypothetical protein